ncbi:uncharacterized protein LOC118192392 isoform X2 [Stegodyphus dumicola]|uniref:uncharacterized protein LOC118192392 isoform X2 n=1 Tax=Stegodyphus dumicola TaxID=202533 RepID=UPI0015B1CA4D|nr:uncharacterized protein LOC118192392 isoform X2 [Stegodyphus dumicola]
MHNESRKFPKKKCDSQFSLAKRSCSPENPLRIADIVQIPAKRESIAVSENELSCHKISRVDNSTHKQSNISSPDKNLTTFSLCKFDPHFYDDCPDVLIRSASLPNCKSVSHDWLQPWMWKCHSLEDWLWYLEEQPCRSRDYRQIANMLPDDYKLVYVSSTSLSSESDSCLSECDSDGVSFYHRNYPHTSEVHTKARLKVHSHIKINYGTSYVEDSDWELESDESEDSELFVSNFDKSIVHVNEADNFIIQPNLYLQKNMEHEITIHCSSDILRSKEQKGSIKASVFIMADIKLTNLLEFKHFSNFAVLQFLLQKQNSNPVELKLRDSVSVEAKVTEATYDEVIIKPTLFSSNNSCGSSSALCALGLPNFFLLVSTLDVERHKSYTDIFYPNSFSEFHISEMNYHSFCIAEQISLLYASSNFYCSREISMLNFLFRTLNMFCKVICLQEKYVDVFRFCTSYPCYVNISALAQRLSHFNFLHCLLKDKWNKILAGNPSNAHFCSLILLFSLYSFYTGNERMCFSCISERLNLNLNCDELDLFHISYIQPSEYYTNKKPLEEGVCNLMWFNDRKESRWLYKHMRQYLIKLYYDFFRMRFSEASLLFLLSKLPFTLSRNCNIKTPRCGPTSIYFLHPAEFCNPSWLRDCYGKVGNLLHLGDANAFHYVSFPPCCDPTNRGNDKSATGWGKARCCIAAATQRVIDLNLRASVCGREVLDSAGLTLYLGWAAGTGALSSAKLGAVANLVNAFFYYGPPVTSEPEADYLLTLTISDQCLLLQRILYAKEKTRMIASKLDYTGVSSLYNTDNDKTFYPAKSNEVMLSQENVLSARNLSECCDFISDGDDTPRLKDLKSDIITDECLQSLSPGTYCETVSEFKSILNLPEYGSSFGFSQCSAEEMPDEMCVDQNVSFNSCLKYNFSEDETCVTEVGERSDSCDYFDKYILPYLKNIFCFEFISVSSSFDKYELPIHVPKAFHSIDINERVDCQCNKPCDVPSSPSVVDATVERTLADDGEVISSGDELDKLESDTDSQDTVIEGEAYKRIRSVAIKEKILHANEELFGGDMKETYFEHGNSHVYANNPSNIICHSTDICLHSKDHLCDNKTEKQHCEDAEHRNDIPELPLYSDSLGHISLEKHFKDLRKPNLCGFYPVLSLSFMEKKNKIESNECKEISADMHLSSSYKPSFNETVCSSESSDNGSDGEEVILSDTSTSSDEATYIAPSAGFRYYSHPLSYRLHTIMEESCEESEKSSRGTVPLCRKSGDSEYSDKIRVSSSRNPRKMHRKNLVENSVLNSNTDYKTSKGSPVYAVLATSRLEKYFKSGLLDRERMSYPEDDLTDESGGVSSDDEICSVGFGRFSNQSAYGKLSGEKYHNLKKHIPILKEKFSLDYVKSPSLPSCNTLSTCNSNPEISTEMLGKKYSVNDLSQNVYFKEEISYSEAKQSKSIDYDDEAKYIMSHLMQHITSNTDVKTEVISEMKDISPMLKILESEIARLMLTVSPASLSAGEPSSSCSSTLGSNNSDYGSDTLESAEESTSDEEINSELVSENRDVLDLSSQTDSVPTSALNEATSDTTQSSEIPQISDSAISEETLYICKQLMASLKKIADASECSAMSNELCSNSEDHSAKQYITDQIVSLMQTVSASHNNSPLLRRLSSNPSPVLNVDSDVSHDCSDSDSPPPNDEKQERSKSKTPSESGSETTISASISIPSYDDSDRTPTESEISHEMDELYALLESNSTSQDVIASKFSYDLDTHGLDKNLRNIDSPLSEDDGNFTFTESCDNNSDISCQESSLLSGVASKLESLLPISIEERIARYKDAFFNKAVNDKESECKSSETRINVILPQPSVSEMKSFEVPFCNNSNLSTHFSPVLNLQKGERSFGDSFDNIMSCSSHTDKGEDSYNITSVKIISHNTYPLSSAIHKILSNNIDSRYLEQKLDYQIVNVLDTSANTSTISVEEMDNSNPNIVSSEAEESLKDDESTIIAPLPKVMNPKEKASSENDLLVANYRAKSKNNKVFGTKSVGNISDLENISNKSAFRDTGYYSFKSSEESFLSLDDSTASQTSTASLTQYRSLTSTETIPEEEESCAKGAASTKMSLSSSNIPDAVCDTTSSKSSTLPLSLRSKLSVTPGGNHRTRSSFFSTSGVLRKLTLLRDESGNSLRSSPHGRLRIRNRSLSGGSEDGKQRKASVPQISVSECPEGRSGSVTSVYSAAGGGRYGTVTVTGEVLFGLNYNYKTGTLEINVKECRNLAAVDTKKNRSDPYVKVYLLPDRTKSGKRKTKVKKHTLNPVFDEHELLKFNVTVSELEIRTLWLSVWHSDRFGRNDFLGEVMLPLGSEMFENSDLKWYPLQERVETLDTPVSYKGDLILALKYVPPDVTSRKFSKKPGVPAKGALEVLVREARNLMATRSNGTSDPFCKSYLLPDKSKAGKQKTPVFKKSCNPKWNHTFIYDEVSLDDLRERCLELTIWDYDKITSNDFLGGVRLCLGTGKYQGRDVDWMDSVGEERSLWYTMLERPNTWVDGSLLLRSTMQSRRTV